MNAYILSFMMLLGNNNDINKKEFEKYLLSFCGEKKLTTKVIDSI